MSTSSNSVADRIKQQAAAYSPQAKDLELDRLRQEHGLLVAQHKVTVEQNAELTRRVEIYMDDLSVILDFIAASGVEITEDVANVISRQEELRIIRRVWPEITGKQKTGMLYDRGKT